MRVVLPIFNDFGYKDAIERREKDAEYLKAASIPEWKRVLMEKQGESPARYINKKYLFYF